jgi:ADP-L-glycero-D-manno-heptose 6-epimerase
MIVLTGGAGFIGSCVLAKLNTEGHQKILVVDNLAKSEKWRNLQGKRFENYLHKDEFLSQIVSSSFSDKVQAVIHLGACSSTTETDAEYMMRNNYAFSRKLAEWSLSKGARFIYASSAATYGAGEQGFVDNEAELEKLRPLNVYGYSKHLFDLWAKRTGHSKRMVGLKFFNVFGPNEYHKGDMSSVVLKAFHEITKNSSVELFKSYRSDYGDGEQKRDFVAVQDCCEVISWLLQNPQVNGLYNLGSGKARSWKDLANSVFLAMGKQSNIKFKEMPDYLQPKYQYFTEASMEKLRSAGYTKPLLTLEEGVRVYVQDYLMKELSYC